MTNSRLYAAAAFKDDKRLYAVAVPFRSSDNIIAMLKKYLGECLFVNVYTSRKDCDEVVWSWNESFVANGTFFGF